MPDRDAKIDIRLPCLEKDKEKINNKIEILSSLTLEL